MREKGLDGTWPRSQDDPPHPLNTGARHRALFMRERSLMGKWYKISGCPSPLNTVPGTELLTVYEGEGP
jgi:hypothetical protein